MGGDKAGVRLGGVTLLERVAGRLAPQVAELAVAGGDGRAGWTVLPDPVPGRVGPLAGLLAGMLWASGRGATHVVSVPVDAPFLPLDLVAQLAGAGPGAAIPFSGGRRHPVFGLWPVMLAARLRADLEGGQRRAGVWAAAIGAVEVPFPEADPDPFFNLNTPVDLACAARVPGV
ncbi:hypothetical protein CCR78_11035 [Rhodovulum imhoffii]|nr:hypothetical protein [Rhodovulum imhoffii]